MQIYINEKYIKRRSTVGKWTMVVALIVLLAGSAISFSGNFSLLPLSLVCLAVGFVTANVGSFYMRRFVRQPRPDEVIARNLKGLDDRHEFFAWQLPAPNVLLTPAGLFAVVTREQDGKVTVTGNQWKQPFRATRLLTAFSQESLGNPAREAADDAARLRAWIQKNNPELDVQPQPVVVFINPQVQLTLNDPVVPVALVKDMKDLVRKQGQSKENKLNDATRKKLSQLFAAAAS